MTQRSSTDDTIRGKKREWKAWILQRPSHIICSSSSFFLWTHLLLFRNRREHVLVICSRDIRQQKVKEQILWIWVRCIIRVQIMAQMPQTWLNSCFSREGDEESLVCLFCEGENRERDTQPDITLYEKTDSDALLNLFHVIFPPF